MANSELTKEQFKDIFEDNFEMTNYAIHLAQEQIHSGNEELNVNELLREIKKHPPRTREADIQDEDFSEHE